MPEMATHDEMKDVPLDEYAGEERGGRTRRWLTAAWRNTHSPRPSSIDTDDPKRPPEKWSFGSILLLSKVSNQNAPLGLHNTPARASASSLPSPFPDEERSQAMFSKRNSRTSLHVEKKRTKDGEIILEPQPDESMNDPLNWPVWRRDVALICLGFYCMVGGGMTPILAAGFTNVAATFHVSIPQVALTTGLYMMGLGVGSVIASPTAILFGKRPVYMIAAVLFILTSVWCALSPNYASLVVARVIQGMAVSPVECLPSATIAEIFFLHERAYRLGVYTLLLLGGKNLVPLVSAAIIQGLNWRWVFWIVAIVVGFCFFLLFFLVPETFWDRSPRPHKRRRSRTQSQPNRSTPWERDHTLHTAGNSDLPAISEEIPETPTPGAKRLSKALRVGFVVDGESSTQPTAIDDTQSSIPHFKRELPRNEPESQSHLGTSSHIRQERPESSLYRAPSNVSGSDYFTLGTRAATGESTHPPETSTTTASVPRLRGYTSFYRSAPTKTYVQTLKPWSGRLSRDSWFRVAFRPFILFAYPSVLWSTVVYSLSVGWLIVLSESVSTIYRTRDTYNFTALQAGLVYLSPFIGGVLGTAVAGKVSDLIVRFMARKNGGVYEPEFRLVMAIPVTLCTTIGLMGYGWSAQEKDNWIVPTVFFGIISFGCSLGSTTAITFCVDSYRQYAGEALVTLNFSKNIFHGLVFSLFFNRWLTADGSKAVFLALGGIQLAFLLFTIPMYIFGKRARMWTVRRNMMENF